MKDEIKKKVLKPLGLYALAFSLVLPSLSGVVEAAADIKESKADKILASQEKKIEENKNKAQEPKKEVKEENKDESKEKPQLETKKAEKETRPDEREKAIVENTDESDNDELEISDENVAEAVRGTKEIDPKLTKPTINPVAIGANIVTGNGLAGAGRRKHATGPCKIHVTVTDGEGNKIETKTFSIGPKERPKKGEPQWSVTLDSPVQKGYKIVAQQELDGKFSNESDPYIVKELLAEQHKNDLKMPSGDFYLEQYVANILNDDEKAEALDLLKKANPAIAKDIKSVEFTITGATTKTASYVVTYTDNSVSEEIQAPGLTIKPVTETSRSPEIGSITIVDNVIKGKLAGSGSFDGIKVQLVLNVNKAKADQYCNENKCTVDKDSSDPIDVTLQSDGTFSYTLKERESLELDQIVGVSVKEPHKFVSCSTTTVKPVIPEKTEVRDPRKLTGEDKGKITEAIKKAYTLDGVSKLPNGTGVHDGVPAVIQIDDSGNVKIFNGNDVVVNEWDDNGKAIPEKNEDGSVKLKDGAQPKITIAAKDLVKNIKPDSPKFKADYEAKKLTITLNKVDTDAKKVNVTYTPEGGTEETTVEFTKDKDGNWTGPEGIKITVNEETGEVTLELEISNLKGNTNVKATVTDVGGIADDDKDELTSEEGKELLRPVISFDGNKGTGSMDKVYGTEKDKNFKLPENKFKAPEGKEFDGWEVNGQKKKVGDDIKIADNTVVKAIWKGTSKPEPTPEPEPTPSPREGEPAIKHKDYTPTYPVYVTVPKTEKVEKVPVGLEIHKAYIAGYEDNTLRAEGNITRAEAAAMVTRLAGLDLSDNSMPNFKDMQKNAWYFRYINAAVKANMLDADNGMMRPNDKITRAEFAKMLAAIDKENSSVSKFEDIKGHRYEKEINKIYGNNRIEGYEDGSFRPDANLTRAESAAFLNRMFNRIADKEAYAGLEDKLAKFKDFDSSKWYYDEMVEATNSHELTRRGTASDKFGRVYEKWTRVLGSDVR